jgi:hypothetical protein
MRQLLCLLLLLSAGSVAAQATDPALALARQDYLLKSYSQRRAANVMLVMGGSVAVTSALGIASAFQNSNINPSYLVWERVMVAGLGVAAVSVPLYIAARYNRKRAAALSVQLGVSPRPAWTTGATLAAPTVGLRLRF